VNLPFFLLPLHTTNTSDSDVVKASINYLESGSKMIQTCDAMNCLCLMSKAEDFAETHFSN